MKRNKISLFGTILLLSFVLAFNVYAGEEQVQINWIEGPGTMDLGSDIAQVELGENYVFAGADDSKTIMTLMGNPISDQEIGLIMPGDEERSWFLLFEYDPIGYIKDDDKDDIDANALLESIRAGTEEANKQREEMGISPLHIVGWYEEPHYDTASNNLVWAILGEDDEGQVVNYNTRLLGRYGYTSVVLVTEPEALDADKNEVAEIMSSFSYKQGKKYSEFKEGDKVAAIGLTALIAGGAGAAAAKFGLFKFLAKAWKAVAAGAVALFAAIGGFLKKLFGKKD